MLAPAQGEKEMTYSFASRGDMKRRESIDTRVVSHASRVRIRLHSLGSRDLAWVYHQALIIDSYFMTPPSVINNNSTPYSRDFLLT